MRRIYFLILVAVSFSFIDIFSQAIVVGATGATDLCPGSGVYATLTNITIAEGANDDFSTSSKVFVLGAPSGFNFKAAVGTLTITPGTDVISSGITVTTTSIVVNLDLNNGTADGIFDAILIGGIQVKANVGATITGANILRINGTTSNLPVNGDDVGDNVSHGTLIARNYSVTISTNSPSCNGGSGTLTANIYGTAGVPGYAYIWSPSGGAQYTMSGVASVYNVSATDGNGSPLALSPSQS